MLVELLSITAAAQFGPVIAIAPVPGGRLFVTVICRRSPGRMCSVGFCRPFGVMKQYNVRPLPSAANFVTVVTPRPAAEIALGLRAKNIFVLPFPWPQTPGALRITVGTRQDTDAFLAAIRDVMAA